MSVSDLMGVGYNPPAECGFQNLESYGANKTLSRSVQKHKAIFIHSFIAHLVNRHSRA